MSVRVSFDDLTLVGFDASGTEMYNYQGLPFTGIIEEYVNSVLISEIEYKNSYREGVCRAYYPNGQMSEEYFLKYNGLDGSFKTWDSNGHLNRDTTWVNGVCTYDSGDI